MAIGTSIKVSLDTKAVARGFANIKAGFKRLSARVSAAGKVMMAPFFKLQALIAPLLVGGAGIVLLKNASKQAAEIEVLAKSFEQLLGGVEASQKRVKELKRFSLVTPYDPTEVMKSSRILETMGGELLSTGEGLRMVGDAASVANEPLSLLSVHMGRLFGVLTSGGEAGDSINRLQELGLISGKAKIGFQDLAAAQKKGEASFLSHAEALKLMQFVLRRTSGAMEKFSKTFSGRISTLKGNWQELLEALGSELNIGLGKIVDRMIKFLPTLTEGFKAAGSSIVVAFESIMGMIQGGTLLAGIGSVMKHAAIKFGEILVSVLEFAMQHIIKQLAAAGVPGIKDPTEARLVGTAKEIGGVLVPTGFKYQEGSPMLSMPEMMEKNAGLFSSGEAWSDIKSQLKSGRDFFDAVEGFESMGYELVEANKIAREILRNTKPAGAFNR